MSKNLKKPSFIPSEFYKHACFTIDNLERVVESEKDVPDEFLYASSNRKALKYASNLVSEYAPESFYKKFSSNTKLLNNVLFLFYFQLPNWEIEFKTTGNEDYKYIKKASDATLKLLQNINNSPDLMFNIQLNFFGKYVIKIINEAASDIVLEEGKKAKQITKELIFLNHLFIDKLSKNSIIKYSNKIFHGQSIHFTNMLSELHEYLENIAPLAKNKTSTVKKIRYKKANVVYASKKLHEMFVGEGLTKAASIKMISELISNVMDEDDINEEAVRKNLKE